MATVVGALPDDALADVFRGLPPRSLAMVRCVCKAWRDVVDARALLLPHLHLLPRAVRGVFMNFLGHAHPHHFARPCSPSSSTVPRVDGTLSFLPTDDHHRRWVSVLDHCNGLVLVSGETEGLGELCVCNPATRRWTVLPRWWVGAGAVDDDDDRRGRYAGAYIAFDPAESPEYQVILVPALPKPPPSPPEVDHWTAAEVRRREQLWEEEKHAPFCLDWFFALPDGGGGTAAGLEWEIKQEYDVNNPSRYMEWPPAPWTLRVFSSSTGQWEDRDFVRGGMPAGTVEKMRSDQEALYNRPRRRCAVYHRGSLYVHCRGSFVTRLSLSKSKYQVVETPTDINNEYKKPYLGKLWHNGVCFGIVHDRQLKIWILNEACGQMEWVLKYKTAVGHYAKYLASIAPDYSGRRHDGAWLIEENIKIQDTDHDVESLSEDSDYDDEFLSEEENIEIQDTDHDVESLSEEDIETQDTDHDVESLSEEDIETQDTNHDVESLREEENFEIQDPDHDVESLSEEGNEWDSDNDDTFTVSTDNEEYLRDDPHLNIVGFHPYKEAVFMVRQSQVVAYHLNSTKIQYLGNSSPKHCRDGFWNDRIYESFLYTPCMIGDLLHGHQTSGQSSSEDKQ